MCYNQFKDRSVFDEKRGESALKDHKRKFIAPIVVTIIMVLYFIVYFGFLISLLEGFFKFALAIIPFAFSAVLIGVCIQRINEIKKGEEDDISKY